MPQEQVRQPDAEQPECERKKLSGLARVLSILLAIAIALVTPLSLLAWDVYRTVYNPPLMKRVLTELVTQSDLIPVALQWYSNVRAEARAAVSTAVAWVDEPDIAELLAILSLDEWRAERGEVLPDYILAEWVGATVDGVYAWIDSADRNPQIVWPMQALKERVHSEHGRNAIQIVYDALEPCVPEQIADFNKRMDAAPVGKEVPYNLCQFPQPWTEDQFNDYHNALLEVIDQIPPQFALTVELAAVEDVEGAGPEMLKLQLRLARLIGRYALWALLAVLLVAAVWAIWRWRPFGVRWGIGLLVGGAILLALSLLYATAIIWALGRGPLSEAPPLVVNEARLGIVRVGRVIFQPALIQALVACLVAIVGIVLVAVLRGHQKDEGKGEELTLTKG